MGLFVSMAEIIFKIFFILKYIKIIFFKKNLFLKLAHQNNPKTSKKS